MQTHQLVRISVFLLLFLISACGETVNQVTSAVNSNLGPKVWVFVQINIPESDGEIEDYYYFGEISEPDLNAIESNTRLTGFFTLYNTRYWNNDDVVEEYKDNFYSGDRAFRIEHLVQFDRMEMPYPIGYIYGPEDEAEDISDEKPPQTE